MPDNHAPALFLLVAAAAWGISCKMDGCLAGSVGLSVQARHLQPPPPPARLDCFTPDSRHSVVDDDSLNSSGRKGHEKNSPAWLAGRQAECANMIPQAPGPRPQEFAIIVAHSVGFP